MEGDFQFYYGIDYRDRYRRGGGQSRLTFRRLLVLVDRLPEDSAFRSAVEDRFPISPEVAAIYRVEEALTGQKTPMWDAKKRARQAMEHRVAVESARPRARAHNNKFLEARRRRLRGG